MKRKEEEEEEEEEKSSKELLPGQVLEMDFQWKRHFIIYLVEIKTELSGHLISDSLRRICALIYAEQEKS